jgi:hypothetical protein
MLAIAVNTKPAKRVILLEVEVFNECMFRPYLVAQQ